MTSCWHRRGTLIQKNFESEFQEERDLFIPNPDPSPGGDNTALSEELVSTWMNKEVLVLSSGLRPLPMGQPHHYQCCSRNLSNRDLGGNGCPWQTLCLWGKTAQQSKASKSPPESESTELWNPILKLCSMCLIRSLMKTLQRVKLCTLKKWRNISK